MKSSPLDVIEDFIFAKEWVSHRLGNDEIVVEFSGRSCEYNIHFIWNDESGILHFYVIMSDIKIPKNKMQKVYELLSRLNEKLHLGHFEATLQNPTPAFRHSLLMPGTRTLSSVLVEDTLDYAIDSCERFFPAFQFVIYGDKSPAEAAAISFVETLGEA